MIRGYDFTILNLVYVEIIYIHNYFLYDQIILSLSSLLFLVMNILYFLYYMFNRFPERRPEWYGTSAETVRITRDSDSDEDIKSPRMYKSSAKINVVDPSKSKPFSNSIAMNDGMFVLRERRVHVTREDFLHNPVSMKQAHHNTINDSILSILLELLILVLELYLSFYLTITQPSQKKRNIINV